ncbi:hypothetical protein FACS189491_02340 [Spirochaetia bacterium]|nr:hypothetical protein FACS189491_02340 [Spirochaetia bacterium]
MINTYLAKDFKLRNFDIEIILANPFRLFSLPDIYEELAIEPYECPVMGLLTQPNLRYLKNRFRKIRIDAGTINALINSGAEDQIKGYEYQNIKWIIEDIDYCLDNKLEMFTTLG